MQRLRPERRPRSPSAGLLVAAFAAATLLFLDAAAAQDAEVKIDNFTFAPPSLTVKAGTTVTWRNEDDIPHTVASSVRVFKSTALDTDDSFSFTFTEPGSYDYFCSMHPHMRGKIVVEPGTHAANPHSRGLRGGAGRTRTGNQTVISPSGQVPNPARTNTASKMVAERTGILLRTEHARGRQEPVNAYTSRRRDHL